MTFWEGLAAVITLLMCFTLAPFMTIGFIFLMAECPILGGIFITIGIINMFYKLYQLIKN